MSKDLPITIRVARLEDADRLSLLSHQLGYAATEFQIQQRLQQILVHPDHRVWVAQPENGLVIGWIQAHRCLLLTSPVQVLISALVVDRAVQGRGVGRQLLQQLETWAIEQGCASVLVRSNVIRHEAHGFYEKMGFHLVKQSMVFSKTLQEVSS